jgi:hypothetical protein
MSGIPAWLQRPESDFSSIHETAGNRRRTSSALDLDHLAQIADMRRKKIVALEREIEAWREVAGHLHSALAASAPGVFPGCGDSAIRCAALESYARLSRVRETGEANTGTTAPYEL